MSYMKPLRGIILGLLMSGLVSAVATGQDPAFRAFWADAFSSGFKSTSQIDLMVARAQTGNYNAIIAEVLAYHDTGSGGHGAYWNSDIVPKATDISGDIDPLAYLVSRAHAVGIEVHAWIVPYRVCTSWPPNGNSLLSAHPEWLMVELADMGGGPATLDGKYVMDPGSPDVQEYLTNIVQELVREYEIDGINLDYIRYTQVDAGYPADESYTKSTLERFRELEWYSGTPPPEGLTIWNNFRRRTIDEFVRRLRVEIPTITSNPRQPVRLTADLFATGDAPANFNNSQAYQLHQNWRFWMEQGYLDAGIPMNYKREWLPPQDQWYRNWVDAAIGWRYDRQIFCGQANYLNPKADSLAQMQYCLTAEADGTSNYSYTATADEDMDGNPEADWTWYSFIAANLFTTPVTVPEMPWRDPGSADEGTLWGRAADPATDEPIDGATIQVDGFGSVQTDGNGYYVHTLIPADPGGTVYDLRANKYLCSQVQVFGVVVLPGEVVRVDINLCDSSIFGDMDEDGDVDANDLNLFAFCMQGPGSTYPSGHFCLLGDSDEDLDEDLVDFALFQQNYEEP
ncbi:MAG: family 10 glycosylhydrolase [Planctomycetota bacterium]